MIVSGLAYGIDTEAHETALHYNLQTVGVLGHGLHMVYPSSNRKLATQMLRKGGLISEYFHETGPEAIHYPSRSNIITVFRYIVVIDEKKEGH